jgi:beta-glucosidase
VTPPLLPLVVVFVLVVVVVAADLLSRLPKRLPIVDLGGDGPFKFPPGFFWGAATSDHQIERAQPDDWTVFEKRAFREKKQDKSADGIVLPGHIYNISTVPADWIDKKTDFDSHFADDLAACRQMGHNAHRFSISWARLFPRAGMTAADPAGLAFYDAVFDHLEKNGLEPFVTLFHFASPQWLWDTPDQRGKRGVERDDAVDAFALFTRTLVQRWGSKVKYWCTLNEPMVWAYFGYLQGLFPPGEQRKGGPKDVVDVLAQLLRMHAAAYREIKAGDAQSQVGIAHHIRHFVPWRKWWALDGIAAVQVDQAFTLDFLDAIESGVLRPALTGQVLTIEGLQGTQDYVGINYYGRFYVKTQPTPPFFTIIPHDPENEGEEKNDVGWAIDETSFVPELVRFSERYGKPLFILENGIADNHDEDVRRQQFIVRHARALWQAIDDGADVRGFFFWSLIDNFEWSEGFDPRFGLLKVDYENGGARSPRPSADVYRQIAANNGISAELWNRLRRR